MASGQQGLQHLTLECLLEVNCNKYNIAENFGLKSHKRGEGLGLVIEGGCCETYSTVSSWQTVLVKRFTSNSLVSLEMIYV